MNDLSCFAWEPRILAHGPTYENPWNNYSVTKSSNKQNTARAVVFIFPSGEAKRFASLTDAEEETGMSRVSIKYAISHSGKIKKHGIIVREEKRA